MSIEFNFQICNSDYSEISNYIRSSERPNCTHLYKYV